MIISKINLTESSALQLTELLRVEINCAPGGKVLEFASGTLSLADSLYSFTEYLACSDKSNDFPVKLHILAESGAVHLIPDDELDEDCYFGRFHLVYTNFGFQGLSHLVDEIMRLRRLLIKGGKMVIMDMVSNDFEKECIKQLKRCGFSDIRSDTFSLDGMPVFRITAEK